MTEIIILLLAVVIDQVLGEPPAYAHPVVWMGKMISFLEKLSPKGATAQFLYGGVIALLVVGAFGLATFYVMEFLKAWSVIAYVIFGALLLKTNFAVRELRRAAMRVFVALSTGQIETARTYLQHLVSRNTEKLDEPLVVAATVESVAENVSDSFIAPVLFFLILGVPGAMAYRAVNTLDAMIGYHGKYEYLGKISARLDDLLNIVPSRLGGVFLVLASAINRADVAQSWRIMVRDHALTESPNAGWTMSAMSGALGVQLEKVGHYRLGDPLAELSPLKIVRAVNIIDVVVALALSMALLFEVLKHGYLS